MPIAQSSQSARWFSSALHPFVLGSCTFVVLNLVAIATITGCSQDDVNKLVNQVQEQTQVVQQEVERVVATGSLHMSLNGEKNFSICNASLLIIGDGRPNVLQLRTYATPDKESIPGVFFQGSTSASSLESLSGQKISGELFVALSASDLWKSDSESSASIEVRSIEGSELVGIIELSKVFSPEGKESQASGPFRAVMNH